LARQAFDIPHVLCKINDPVRSRAYATLGIDTINRTEMMLDSIGRYMGKPAQPGAGDVNVAARPLSPAGPEALGESPSDPTGPAAATPALPLVPGPTTPDSSGGR
jgi:hypothetical protein